MGHKDSVRQAGRRILRLAPGCDPSELTLSSVEGFLLSRIDGRTPWRLLREMGGMSAEETELCLEGWLASGCVEVAGEEVVDSREVHSSRASTPKSEGTEPLRLDASLDLTLHMQRRILQLESRVSGPDRILLGVTEDADGKCIKRAYLKISREFHPDRYFRRNLGPYRAKLEGIFRHVQRAYENLSRASSEEFGSVVVGRHRESPSEGPQSSSFDQQTPLRLPDHVRHEREQKARQLMSGAEQAIAEGRLREAATCMEIATRFDPGNRSARVVLADLRMKMDAESAVAPTPRASVISPLAGQGPGEVGESNSLGSKLDE